MANQPDHHNLFNKIIHNRQFNFQPLEFGVKTGYHVDVKDEEGTRWEFSMFQDDDEAWKITGEKLPDWILESEADLQKAIRDHE